MPPASRTLVIVLVTVAGVLAGFLSYRGARPPASIIPAAPLEGSAAANEPAAEALAPEASPARPIPDTVPDLKLPDLAGQQKSLRDFLGHPLIINFWATWCAPCRREIPLLQQLRHAYHGEGLTVVGIAVDFRSAVADYVHRQAIDYPLLIGEDSGLAAAEQFGMQTVLPFSVFADAQGRIVAVKIGELHRDEADYILGTMRALAAGALSLPQAHAGIVQRLRELAAERARAGVKES
ncbi:MAG TPA: TlpA disulfide reductase family protein [Steroidobacteraceae bacterium]|jgi:thiol-disulfide isomerase/thioredoxin|nr:TlpA disulfide reductase family protein [Steroidobacteraceae bacterium]